MHKSPSQAAAATDLPPSGCHQQGESTLYNDKEQILILQLQVCQRGEQTHLLIFRNGYQTLQS